MSIALKLILLGLLFTFTIASGIWLTNFGKPLNPIIFNIHKLMALASVIFTTVMVINFLKNTPINLAVLILIIVSIMSMLALFVSGALMSLGKTSGNIMLIIHNVSTVIAVITIGGAVCLMVLKS